MPTKACAFHHSVSPECNYSTSNYVPQIFFHLVGAMLEVLASGILTYHCMEMLFYTGMLKISMLSFQF